MSARKTPARREQPPAKVPNKETVEALRQARSGEGLTEYTSLEELKAEFE